MGKVTLESIREDKFISKSLGCREAADAFAMAEEAKARYSKSGNFNDLALAESWLDTAKELQAAGR